jgi:hypothetical protein
MPVIQFRVKLFQDGAPDPDLERARSQKAMLWMLEALCQVNLLWLRVYTEAPLYDAGVLYKKEPPNREHWQDIATTLELRNGDCEDLACWRVAELRNAGIAAHPYIRWRVVNGNHRYHCLVQWPDGRIEDPSIALGMLGNIYRKPVFLDGGGGFYVE